VIKPPPPQARRGKVAASSTACAGMAGQQFFGAYSRSVTGQITRNIALVVADRVKEQRGCSPQASIQLRRKKEPLEMRKLLRGFSATRLRRASCPTAAPAPGCNRPPKGVCGCLQHWAMNLEACHPPATTRIGGAQVDATMRPMDPQIEDPNYPLFRPVAEGKRPEPPHLQPPGPEGISGDWGINGVL